MSHPKKKSQNSHAPQLTSPPKQLKITHTHRRQSSTDSGLPSPRRDLSHNYLMFRDEGLLKFDAHSPDEQQDYLEQLLLRLTQQQLGQLNEFFAPMLQRDFVTLLLGRNLDHVAESILSYLDAKSLCAAELVCKRWKQAIADSMLWKRLIERKVRTDLLWRGLAERRGWIKELFQKNKEELNDFVKKSDQYNKFYRELYPKILADVEGVEKNWINGEPSVETINCQSENSKGVYCLQYDANKIVSGLRDNSIKIWDRNTRECTKILSGHTGSVLCLQFDEKVIVSGSSDTEIKIWDAVTGELVKKLTQHKEAVLHLRFHSGLMVSCSKDRTTAVWDMNSPTDIVLKRLLVGHRAAVNVVDFDEKYIVSASGDRTIKIWDTSTCEFVNTLYGHKRGIACLQYRDPLIVSGSSDNTIRLWDVDAVACIRVLEGHQELVRCIRFDSKRIISGAYDGRIKIWDLKAALNPRSPNSALCLRDLSKHTGRVFRLQFDELHIVSSSHDDTILIWDFLNFEHGVPPTFDNHV